MSLGREYPVFPLPAVSGVIFDDRDRILLIRRANPPAKGKWSLPGGVVKLGEELAEALKREIREECDLTVLVGPLVWASSRIIRDRKDHIQYHYVLLDYLCRSENSNVTVGADASEARFLEIADVNEYETTEGIAEVIQRAVEMKKHSTADDFH